MLSLSRHFWFRISAWCAVCRSYTMTVLTLRTRLRDERTRHFCRIKSGTIASDILLLVDYDTCSTGYMKYILLKAAVYSLTVWILSLWPWLPSCFLLSVFRLSLCQAYKDLVYTVGLWHMETFMLKPSDIKKKNLLRYGLYNVRKMTEWHGH